MVRRLIAAVTVVLALGAVFALPLAQADTTDIIEPQHNPPNAADGFQAATCEEDAPPIFCSPETPGRFFTQAAGHPLMGFTQYIIQHEPVTPLPSPPFPPGSATAPIKEPIAGRAIKTLRVDLPTGLTINPEATPKRCSLAEFELIVGGLPSCDPSTIIGREEVTLVTNIDEFELAPGFKVPKGFIIPPSEKSGTKVPVFNLEPEEGEPAKFGFVVAGTEKVFLTTDAAWESDFHESFTIRRPEPKPPFSTLKSRLLSKGRSGDGTFITNPTSCFTPEEFPHLYSTWFRAESWETQNPTFPNGSTPAEAPFVQLTGCDKVPFEPSLEVDPGTKDVDSPAPATVAVKLPFDPVKEGGETSRSHTCAAPE